MISRWSRLVLQHLLGIAAAVALATPAVAAQADPNRLFADSKLVVRDRFSDEIVGKGPDLVFIPGLSSSRATWKASAERLRTHYRLHLIQFAGFAGEPARANATGEVMLPTAEALDAYLVEQKLTPAVVIGHSLGGTITLYLAEKHSDHLKKALIVDSVPYLATVMMRPGTTPEVAQKVAAGMRDSMAQGGEGYARGLERSLAGMVTKADDRAVVRAWGLATDPTVAARAYYDDMLLDLGPSLSAIKAPIVVLYPDNVPAGAPAGVMDATYPRLYGAAPTVKLKRVDASLHFIMFDQPDAFAKELDAFLSLP